MSDFLEKVETPITATALEEVMEYVTKADNLKARIENGEALLKQLKEQYDELRTKTLPELLLKHGIEGQDLTNGRRIEIEEKVYIQLPKDLSNRRKVIDFLFKNGGGDLVKEKVTVESAPESLKEKLQEMGIPFEHTEDVNTNSFTAWARAALGMKKGTVARLSPVDFPKEANLFIRREAKIL